MVEGFTPDIHELCILASSAISVILRDIEEVSKKVSPVKVLFEGEFEED